MTSSNSCTMALPATRESGLSFDTGKPATVEARSTISSPPTLFRVCGSIESIYEDLAGRAMRLQESSDSSTEQVFIGIAGGPASGKSTLAENVSNIINAKKGSQFSTVLPMDGYHISRADLEGLSSRGEVIGDPESTRGKGTTFQELLARRGAPWTFNSEALVEDLTEAKSQGEAKLPTYSRQTSDPVPQGVSLTKGQKIVLCEGNYLCAFDSEDWAPLSYLWDDKWYITAPKDVIQERLVHRHLQNWSEEQTNMWGGGRQGAKTKAKFNDFKNAQWIEQVSKHHANLVVLHY